jgi:virginiamycin B lyase
MRRHSSVTQVYASRSMGVDIQPGASVPQDRNVYTTNRRFRRVVHRTTIATALLLAGFMTSSVRTVTQGTGQAAAEIDIQIQEWDVPGGAAALPHDPAVAPDGSGWYAAYNVNVLGRVDSTTGQIKEFQLPTANSGPHGLTADSQGNIWYTGNRAALIGKLNPKTGQVTEYKMPDPAARDPHTPAFDQNGVLWFTVQNGNSVGKLDPRTGAIVLAASLTEKAMPHGMVVNSRGTPFFGMAGANKIGAVNPETMKITEYVLPDGARPRRIAVAADDAIWYADNARGFLGRLDPRTGSVKEFPSPGGPKAAPYGIAITRDGAIWFSESEVQPNTVVRFDPRTETTRSWAIPSGGGIVRHMVAAPDGTLWLACSGVGKIATVRQTRTSAQ